MGGRQGPRAGHPRSITRLSGFAGRNIGVWDFGNEYEVIAGALKYELTQGTDYTKVIQPFDMTLLLSPPDRCRRGDDLQRVRAGARGHDPKTNALYQPTDLNVIDYNQVGTAMLQDAILARDAWLKQPGNADIASSLPARVVPGLDVLPRQPGEVHPVHGRRRIYAGRRPPGVDDERDQPAYLAFARWHRRDEHRYLEPDRRDLDGRRDHPRRSRRGRLSDRPCRAGRQGITGDVNGASFQKGTVTVTAGGQ